MNKSKLIWGIICLAIAALLTVANLRLPAEDLMFQVGDFNMPWVPPVVLAIVGVVLVATAGRPEKVKEVQAPAMVDEDKAQLNKRLETIAWGAFLIMLGGFMFVPEEIIGGGWWPIGVGLIMLGLNGARYMNGLRMSGFTTFLGIVSILGGVAVLAGLEGADGPIFLVVLGGYLLLKPYFDSHQLFGKAELS